MAYSLFTAVVTIFMTKNWKRTMLNPKTPQFMSPMSMTVSLRNQNTNQISDFLAQINKYHPNMVFTVEQNPDTAFTTTNGNFNRREYQKPGKLPTHWKSQIATKWKRNYIISDLQLHRAKRISSSWRFEQELTNIEGKYSDAGFPKRFIRTTIDISTGDKPWTAKSSLQILCLTEGKIFLSSYRSTRKNRF